MSCFGADRVKGARRPPKTSCASCCFAGGVSVYPQVELSLWPQLPQPRPSPAHAEALALLFWLGLQVGSSALLTQAASRALTHGPAEPVSDLGLILE